MSLFPGGRKKRRFPRVSPEKGRPIRVDINGVDFLEIVYADNLSEGGLSIVAPHEFRGCKIDQPVSLIISLPEPEKANILVAGIIRYISYTRKIFGVAFVDLKKEDRKKIQRYVEYRMKGD
ncbi:MAG: PilZ domain-containing protein [Deltaproteobacteria bacterium]|nr:PilZ domain-containing protein [Deltaproteobacteria bacterium]